VSDVLVDTDVISYIFKRDSRGAQYADYLEGKNGFYSFQTFAELRFWSVEHRWSAKKWNELLVHLERYILIEQSFEISKQWALAMHTAKKSGRRILAADAWIAATALELNLPLLTHNEKDFLGVQNLKIIAFQEG
jgi:tRNA(fMet)-specific endonuclease VapC